MIGFLRFLSLVVIGAAAVGVTIHADPKALKPTSDYVDFTLPDTTGQLHTLSGLRGRWVLVNFWASWCSPCLKEIPDLIRLSHRYPRALRIVGINFEEIDLEALKSVVDEFGIDYLVVQAGDSPLVPFEPLKGLPTTFLVDPDGQLVFRHEGPLAFEDLDTLMREVGIERE